MANLTLSRLTRTMSQTFRIGNVMLRDDSGIIAARNADDSANADVAVNKLLIRGSNASSAIALGAPASLPSTVTFIWPGSDGATGQVLSTNGSGTLSWIDVAANADNTATEPFSEATTSPLTIFTPPANAVITKVIVEVTSAAAGGAPTISIGTATNNSIYMTTSENDLKEAAIYEVHPQVNVGSSPEAVIATITPDAQTFSGKVYVTYTVPA